MALMLAACARNGSAAPSAVTAQSAPAQVHQETDEQPHHARHAKTDGQKARRRHERRTPEQVIEHFDTNKDGMIQRSEVPEAKQKWFDRVDANHDGVVTKDEIVAFRAAHHHEHEKK